MDNKIIQKLTDLANPDAMTNKDFIANYKIVINHVIEIKKMLAQTASNLKADFENKKSELNSANIREFNAIKNEIEKQKDSLTSLFNRLNETAQKKIDSLRDGLDGIDGEDGKDGQDGKDADEEMIIEKVLEKLELPDIEELELKIKEIGERVDAMPRRGGGTGGMNQAVQYADLTEQCDGVTKTFTIPTCRMVVALMGTQYPIIFRPVIDYTLGNKTITLTDEVSAPEPTQTLTLLYIK